MQTVSFSLFLSVLLFAPLAFGTVEPWSTITVQILVPISFLLFNGAALGLKKSTLRAPGTLPLLLFLAWIAFQLVPLPATLIQVMSPRTFTSYAPLLDQAGFGTWFPLSLQPKATLLALCRWSTFALFYLLCVQLLGESRRLTLTVAFVTTFASLLAVEAIVQKIASPHAIYWFRPAPISSSPVGPWVYSNQFAGFMEMVFPLVLALFLVHRPRVHYRQTGKDILVGLFTMPGANRHLLLGTGAVLIATSIIFSLSRGGIITLCLAFLGMALLSSKITADRRVSWGMVISVAVILLVTWFGWQPIMEEFSGFWDSDGFKVGSRLPLFQDSIEMFFAFPITGTGFGTFGAVYPSFRSLPGDTVYDHAHNDALELLTDGGLIGFLLFSWFMTTVIVKAARNLRKRREQYSILVTCGALTGLLAILLHCFIDFQLPSGANGLYLFFLCGLTVSGAATRLRYRTQGSLLTLQGSRAILSSSLLALVLLISSTWIGIGILKASSVGNPDEKFLNQHLPLASLQELRARLTRAAHLDPLEWDYQFRLGQISTLLTEPDRAQQEFVQACRRYPVSGICLQQLALSLPPEQLPQRDRLLAQGISREPGNADLYLTYSRWLLSQGDRDRALTELNRATRLAAEEMAVIARFIVRQEFTAMEREQILPARAYAWHELGRTLDQLNRPDAALDAYHRALDYMDDSDTNPEYFRRPYELHRRLQQKEQAVALLRRAIDRYPKNPWFRIQLGDYYRGEGIVYRAREEYGQALAQDPENRELKAKIASLENTP